MCRTDLLNGLHKVDRHDPARNVRLIDGRMDTVQLTDEGIVYTLKYKPDIFTEADVSS